MTRVGVQLHLHRLARALGVPDDAGLAVARTASMVLPTALVTAKYWCGLAIRLASPSAPASNAREVAQELQEPLDVADAVDEQLEAGPEVVVALGVAELDWAAVVVDVPRREVVERGERRAVLGEEPVAGHDEHAEPERHRELAQVGLQLGVRCRDVGPGAPAFLSSMTATGSPLK